MAVTGFKTGTFKLSTANTVLTLPTLDFTPTNVLVGIADTTSFSSTDGYVFCGNKTNCWRWQDYDGKEVTKLTYTSTSLGKTTKLTASQKWLPATYQYVAWREEE